MIKLVTVSDDRFGRKDGRYAETQDRIEALISQIMPVKSWRWEDIIDTKFYRDNKTLLDNTDAARNGRAYKPFVILDALNSVDNGDLIVYNDCSPELWEGDINLSQYDLNIIQKLTIKAGDILAPFIRWGLNNLTPGDLGDATHKNYTLNRCMDKMNLRFYEDAYMCASGMLCIRKTPETVAVIEEWLKWNCIDECCALGWAHIPDDASFWEAESHCNFGEPGYKLGCRHDQSILGLLLAQNNHKFVETACEGVHFANFLQYCRPEAEYRFIECLPELNIGVRVINKQGTKMTVFDRQKGEYIVGVSNASMYSTKRYNLKPI